MKKQVRMAQASDLDAIRHLWDYAFHDGETFERWYFENYFSLNECFVATVDGTVAASLQVIELETCTKTDVIKTGYIVGVDTFPEFRGMGLTAMLLQEVINVYAPQKGLKLLQLMPFEAGFYKPYGFVFSDYHANMKLPLEEFYSATSKTMAQSYHWKRVDCSNARNYFETLESVYNKAAASYDCYVARKTERRWRAVLDDIAMEDGQLMLLFDENENACGYIVYCFKDDALFVREAVSVDKKARAALYYFIAGHRSQVSFVQWSAPEKEDVVFGRAKDKTSVQYYPFMMSLVIDPSVVASFAAFLPEENCTFSVEGCGSYNWQKDTRNIIKISDTSRSAALSRAQLTALVFDRAGYDAEDEDIQNLADLFRYKSAAFNNEYF